MFDNFLNTIKQVLHLKKGIQHYADCIIRNEKGQILLLQRSSNDDFEPNKWCLPGGKIEKGEIPEYAAARELLEETHLQTPLQFIQAVERPGSVSCYFEGYVTTSDYTILDNEEHFRCQWVDVEDIASFDLILDLKDILMNKIGIPIYSTKLMQLEILDATDLFKRNELVEKSFDEDQMSLKDYFECKNIIKSHLDMIVEAAQEQGLLEKGGKRAVIGEKRDFGGRMHIKTVTGWKYFGEGTGSKAREHHKDTASEKATAYKPTAEIKSTPSPISKTSIPEVSALDFLTKTSAGGSGGAYIVSDSAGKKYVVKQAGIHSDKNTLEQLRNEQLADSIYSVMGVGNSEGELKKDAKGNVFKIAPFIEESKTLGSLSKTSLEYKAAKELLQNNFVLDCLLLNWDVIGASKDNVVVKDGKPFRIDNGGSLLYRAKNGLKGEASLTADVSEIDVMRSSKNPSAQDIYGSITDGDIEFQTRVIVANKDKILSEIDKSESTSASKLKALISSRIDSLENKYLKKEEEKKTTTKETSKKIDTHATTKQWKEKMKEGETIVGHKGIAEGIIKHVEEIEKKYEKQYQRYAEDRKISVGEYKQKLQQKIERIAASVTLFRATDINVLDTILNDSKRFKSQFETATSHGSLSPNSRSKAEASYFAFPEDKKANKEIRPIYGYCSTNIHGVQNSAGSHPPPNSASHYGKVTVKIKDEVKKQATFTFGDSLGSDSDRTATPLLAPHFTSFKTAYGDPLDIDEDISKYSGDYVEVQYHNQLTLSDIDSIQLSPLNVDSYSKESLTAKGLEHINKVIEVARKTHLKIQIYGDK